jgi:hypothetical protein
MVMVKQVVVDTGQDIPVPWPASNFCQALFIYIDDDNLLFHRISQH